MRSKRPEPLVDEQKTYGCIYMRQFSMQNITNVHKTYLAKTSALKVLPIMFPVMNAYKHVADTMGVK